MAQTEFCFIPGIVSVYHGRLLFATLQQRNVLCASGRVMTGAAARIRSTRQVSWSCPQGLIAVSAACCKTLRVVNTFDVCSHLREQECHKSHS